MTATGAPGGVGVPGGSVRRGGGERERPMVPRAEFTSYYGREVVKPAPWRSWIPSYLFLGGVAGASSMLAAGAAATGRDTLRRNARLTAAAAIGGGFVALIADLGKPARFVNMLRVAKPTSPMSVGTWILSAYAPAAGVAAAAELPALIPAPLRPVVSLLSGPATVSAAVLGGGVATYTGVLLADTATPAWHGMHRELPFVFGASALTGAAGVALLTVPLTENGPARRLALGGAVLEEVMSRQAERSLGMTAEALHSGRAGALDRASHWLTRIGAQVALVLGGRSRLAARAAGAALLAGSLCTKFAVFTAGDASARDPRYTVTPQRERLRRSGGTTA